jgi:glycolate oxidase iron-sulfur subunit
LTESNLLQQLDYSVLQQCIHCGMCLPTCPTYDATKHETSSPRGRIALMRAVADGKLTADSAQFAEEMYFCLGCLACETACPAGVNYAEMIEYARAEVESNGARAGVKRNLIRAFALQWLFAKPSRLRFVARLLRLDQAVGFSAALSAFLPKHLR